MHACARILAQGVITAHEAVTTPRMHYLYLNISAPESAAHMSHWSLDDGRDVKYVRAHLNLSRCESCKNARR